MAISTQELIGKVSGLKLTSEQLSTMISSAAQSLVKSTTQIGALTQGSQSGGQARDSVNVASRSLSDAAASLQALGRACDDFIQNAAK